MSRKNGRSTDGRFAKGNPGRPPGSRNRATVAVEDLLKGEGEKLTRKAINMALAGDATAMRLCLERVAPPVKQRLVEFELPQPSGSSDAARSAHAVLEAVSNADLTPAEGAQVMQMVQTYIKALELGEIEDRIAALEQRALAAVET